MRPTTFRIFLLDQHQIVRHGLRSLIEATGDLCVVGEGSTALGAAEAILAAKPDVAVVELEIDGDQGVEVCRQVKEADPEIHVLLMTVRNEESLTRALMAGASGFIRKNLAADAFLNGLRIVAAGHSLFDTAMATEALRGLQKSRTSPHAPSDELTKQDFEILDLIAEGKTNKQIAQQLFMSPHTVKNRVTKIMSKLGASGRTQAAIMASQRR
jgi:DNA-binding NarL/FixJ family response regulator